MAETTKKQSIFRFRQFSIDQQHCAMKVGTDGVLLGAWAGVKAPSKILDIGTGSGLIALMLAQRFPAANIHAIDLDELAVEQALINVAASPYRERVQVFHASMAEWASAKWHQYDLIVCNPPYFKKGWPVNDPTRKKARDASFLPLEDLFNQSINLSSSEGILSIILPANRLSEVDGLSELAGWKIQRQLQVFTRKGKPAERVMLEWGQSQKTNNLKELLIEDDSGYTADYIDLVESFYLNMA